MDSSQQAITKQQGNQLSNSTRILSSCLLLAGLLSSTGLVQAQSPQTNKTNSTSTRSRLASKTSITNPASAANDVQQLLTSGQQALDSGLFDQAVSTFNRVITLSANNPKNAALANLKIGNAYMVQRKFENAVIGYQRATTLDPDYAEAYNNLGEAQGELKQYPRAIEAFTRAFALDPTLLKAKYNQAVTYDRMGNFRYSEFVFRNLIKSNPNYSLAYDGLAVTLSKAGRGNEAIAFHEKAIALNPQEPSYYYNCAISYLMLKNVPKALEQQEKLKQIDPAIADRLASVIVKRQLQ
jgi:tetratricopeptide (TPR) repeat protein